MKTEGDSLSVVDNPLVTAKLSILRAATTALDEFRRNLQELSIMLLAEAGRDWETEPIEIETPLKQCTGRILRRPTVLVPILRAGLGMLDGALRVLPKAAVGHIGIYRDEETLLPVTYFCRLPVNLIDAQVVLLDPMLATGNSACEAVTVLKAQGAQRIQFLCAVACPIGIGKLQANHPDVSIVTAAVDPELNDFGFIVPGIGDAGDRYFGTSDTIDNLRKEKVLDPVIFDDRPGRG